VFGITDLKRNNEVVPGMVMELACCSLEEYLHLKQISTPEKWKFCEDIIQGLNVIHKSNKVHADISLDNILICGMTAKIGDFGRTIKYGDILKDGKKGYIAPEVYNSSTATKEYDIFSFGVVAWQIFTERTEITKRHMNYSKYFKRMDDVMTKCQMSEEQINFVRSCLNENPKMRPTSEELLKIVKRMI